MRESGHSETHCFLTPGEKEKGGGGGKGRGGQEGGREGGKRREREKETVQVNTQAA